MGQNKTGSQKERRRHPRLDVQIWGVEKNDNSSYFHLLSNLSVGGFFIDKKFPFQAGSVVNMELELDGEMITLKGKVINNYKDSTGNFTGAGVQFIEMDESIKSKIETYLEKLEKENQGII
ncbi:MAG: PilZ domain-containing protein [Desulfobacteraceae bacterium]|jgi:Tfp pilus assembly protein PilZ